jgi:uncharacterized protein YxeA
MKKILLIIGVVIAAISTAFIRGKKTEQKKQNEEVLQSITETKKRRDKRVDAPVSDDLRWLLNNKDS